MARSIDAGREPRVRLDAELSAEAAQRLHDVLSAVGGELMAQAGIEGAWPVVVALAALEDAARSGDQWPLRTSDRSEKAH